MYGFAEWMAQVEESFHEAVAIRKNIEGQVKSEGHVTLDSSTSESESSDSESRFATVTNKINILPLI